MEILSGLLITVAMTLMPGASAGPQVVGQWDIPYSTPDELLLSLTADAPLFARSGSVGGGSSDRSAAISGVRPVVYVHCTPTASRVLLDPPEDTFILQFDDTDLIRVQYVERIERAPGRPPMMAVADPDGLIGALLEHERLNLIDRRAGGGRTHFSLAGFAFVLEELGDPCGWLPGS